MATYYFNSSGGSPTDANSAWTDDANVFDGSLETSASCNLNGSVSVNFLLGQGTDAPLSAGGVITLVRVRHYDSNFSASSGLNRRAYIYTDGLAELLGNSDRDSASAAGYSSYTSLSVPTGGWTFAKLRALEVKCVATAGGDGIANFFHVEIEVTVDSIPGRIYMAQGFQ